MKVSVLLFALYRERMGTSQIEIELSDRATSVELMTRLRKEYPSLPILDSVLIAVNSEYVDSDAPLHDGDEVAIIPPVSGG